DRAHPFLGIGNFVDSALPGETPDGLANLALRQLLDRLLEPWIALTDDLIEPRRCHAGLLELLKRASGFDPLVLSRIPDEDDPIPRAQPLQEVVDLSRARQARLVDEEQPRARVRGRLSAREVVLQCPCLDAGRRELFGRAGGRGEAFDRVAMPLRHFPNSRERRRLADAGSPLYSKHLIPARQDLDDSATLGLAEHRGGRTQALEVARAGNRFAPPL